MIDKKHSKNSKTNSNSNSNSLNKANITINLVQIDKEKEVNKVTNSFIINSFIKAFCIENSPLKIKSNYEVTIIDTNYSFKIVSGEIITTNSKNNTNTTIISTTSLVSGTSNIIDEEGAQVAFNIDTEIQISSNLFSLDNIITSNLKEKNKIVDNVKEILNDDFKIYTKIDDNDITKPISNLNPSIEELTKYIKLGLNKSFIKSTAVNKDEFDKIKNNFLEKLNYKGIVLSGSLGIGKTHVLEASINSYLKNYNDEDDNNRLYFFTLKSLEESHLKLVINCAKLLNHSIVLINKQLALSLIHNASAENEKPVLNLDNKIVLNFINEVKSISIDYNVLFIIETVYSGDDLYKELRLAELFDICVNISLPDFSLRKNIINFYLNKLNNNLKEEEIEKIADKTQGFTPSDLISLIK